MRKLLFILVSSLLFSAQLTAENQVRFDARKIDYSPLGNKPDKSPMRPPLVYIEAHILSFAVDHPDYLLIIKDEDDEEVYSTIVPSAETEVVLPSSLSGDYEIQLVMGNWLFSGWINL